MLFNVLEELYLPRCLDRNSLHLANLSDRRLGALAVGDQIDGQQGSRSAEPGLAMNRNGMLETPLGVDEPHEFQRLLKSGCATIRHREA